MKTIWIEEFPCPKCGGTGTIKDPKAEGEYFRELRLNYNVPMRHVAKVANCSAPYLCDLEHGKRNWTPAIRKAYKRACHPRWNEKERVN